MRTPMSSTREIYELQEEVMIKVTEEDPRNKTEVTIEEDHQRVITTTNPREAVTRTREVVTDVDLKTIHLNQEDNPEETQLTQFQKNLDPTEKTETHLDEIEKKIDLRNPTVMLPDPREVVINQEIEIQRDLNAKMSNLRETRTTSPIEETRTSHRKALPELQ
jgi:hypothetical protein